MTTIHPPRLPAELSTLGAPDLVDAADWNCVEITGEPGGARDVAYLELSASRLTNVRLTGRRFDHLRLVDVLVEDCELSGVTLSDSHFTRVEFRRCRLSGLVASTLKARHVRFHECRADGAMFRMTTWDHAELSDVDLRDADFYAAALAGVSFNGCDLTGVDLSKATMTGTRLHGSTLEGVRGADSLRGAIIGSDQILPVALSVFAAMGIVVEDE